MDRVWRTDDNDDDGLSVVFITFCFRRRHSVQDLCVLMDRLCDGIAVCNRTVKWTSVMMMIVVGGLNLDVGAHGVCRSNIKIITGREQPRTLLNDDNKPLKGKEKKSGNFDPNRLGDSAAFQLGGIHRKIPNHDASAGKCNAVGSKGGGVSGCEDVRRSCSVVSRIRPNSAATSWNTKKTNLSGSQSAAVCTYAKKDRF
jgi:hypothetical protein